MKRILHPQEVGKLSRPISKHIDNEKILSCIDEVERLEVKPMIGYSLMKEIADNPTAHEKLLEGGEYELTDGEITEFAGLKKAIAYYVYARLIMAIDNNATRYGFVNKESNDSNRVTWAEKNKEIQSAIETGNCYMKEVAEYMRSNPEMYSDFRIKKHPKQHKYRIIGD